MKTVIHEPPLASHLHEIRVLHDLQVVRDGHNFRFEQFCNVADREFAVSQRIHDPQAMGVTQRLETFRAEIRVKNFLCHEKSPLRKKTKDHETIRMMLVARRRAGKGPGDQTATLGQFQQQHSDVH